MSREAVTKDPIAAKLGTIQRLAPGSTPSEYTVWLDYLEVAVADDADTLLRGFASFNTAGFSNIQAATLRIGFNTVSAQAGKTPISLRVYAGANEINAQLGDPIGDVISEWGGSYPNYVGQVSSPATGGTYSFSVDPSFIVDGFTDIKFQAYGEHSSYGGSVVMKTDLTLEIVADASVDLEAVREMEDGARKGASSAAVLIGAASAGLREEAASAGAQILEASAGEQKQEASSASTLQAEVSASGTLERPVAAGEKIAEMESGARAVAHSSGALAGSEMDSGTLPP